MVNKLKPWLWISSKAAHDIAPIFLHAYSKIKPYQTLTWASFTWRGMEFTNPIGIAGGVDKDADHIQKWWCFGPGFIEVGTVTPQSQQGHKGKVMDRNTRESALWNKLGFPSKGIKYFANNVKQLYEPRFTPVFANIGKNKFTKNEEAHEDYIKCMTPLVGKVDAFVINISSPNTEGLRELLKPESLKNFLQPITEANRKIAEDKNEPNPAPLLLKISPDITDDELKQILTTSLDLGIDGWILTNSSIGMRDKLSFPSEGGVSGRPLTQKSKDLLIKTVGFLGDRRKGKLIVSCGGIMSPEDVFERLKMGANLVQVYSALVFSGPFFFRQVAEQAQLHNFKLD